MADFARWKAAGEGGLYDSPIFGKDGAYRSPKVCGQYALRHVHLVPLADIEALKAWKAAFRRGSNKTSDRALVYTGPGSHGFLLIFILDEPSAHAVAEMKTAGNKQLMNAFAVVAEAFLHDGSVKA